MKREAAGLIAGAAILALVSGSAGQGRVVVAASKMYWTDLGIKKIQRVNLSGAELEDLVTQGLIVPRGLALDVSRGKMYWTDGVAVKIQRANLDGKGVEDVVTTGLSNPGGIALDVPGGEDVLDR